MTGHTESSMLQLLRQRHFGDNWAFVPKVPNGTGTAKSRTADGIAMSLWPSKGLHLHGFEVKVSRSDWLREIQDVSKAAAFSKFCHYWWIAAPPKIVKLEEMPADWGLLEANKAGLRVKKAATLTTPEPLDYAILAGIFRVCLRESASENDLRAAHQRGHEEGYRYAEKRVRERGESSSNHRRREYDDLQRAVNDFEQSSGIKITAHSGKRLGNLVKLVGGYDAKSLERMLSSVKETCGRLSSVADSALEDLKHGVNTPG